MAESAQLQTLLATVNKLNQGFQDATKHSQAFNKRIKQAQKKVQNVTSSLGNVINFAEKFAGSVPAAKSSGGGKSARRGGKSGTARPGFFAGAQSQFTAIGKGSQQTGQNILQTVAKVDAQIAKVSNAWQQFNGILEQSGIGNTAFGQRIMGVVNKINLWKETYGPLVTRTLEFATSVGEALKSVGKIASSIGNLLGSIRKLGGVLGQVGKTVLPIVGKSMRWFGTIFMSVGRALLANPIGLVVGAIAAAAFLIIKYWEPIKAFFLNLWEPIKAVFFSVWNSITGFFGGIWNQIKAAFSGGISGIASLILNWSPLGLFYQGFSKLLNWFGIDLPGKFSEFGGMLINGLVNGITNAIGAVKEAITNVASSVTGWFKGVLGIESPSRVFAEMGGFISQGVSQGIGQEAQSAIDSVKQVGIGLADTFTNSSPSQVFAKMGGLISEGIGQGIGEKAKSAIDSVKQMGSGLTQFLPDELAAPVTGGIDTMANAAMQILPSSPISTPTSAPQAATQPSNNVFNIHPSQGMDEEALARLITQKLEERERYQAARQNSRLYDAFA